MNTATPSLAQIHFYTTNSLCQICQMCFFSLILKSLLFFFCTVHKYILNVCHHVSDVLGYAEYVGGK